MATRRDLLSGDQAAKYLGVTTGWLAAHADDGPTITRFGRDDCYLQSDLDDFLKSRRAAKAAVARAATVNSVAPTPPAVKRAPPPVRANTTKTRLAIPMKSAPPFAQTTQIIGVDQMRSLVQNSRRVVGPPPLARGKAAGAIDGPPRRAPG